MKLELLTLQQCRQVRLWRNECLETLRTPYPLTDEMQVDFYRDVICNRNSPHRYWAIVGDVKCASTTSGTGIPNVFMGMGGITNIQWENRLGEISLIIEPALQGKGYGEKAVDLLLEEAFHRMNLNCVYGECYTCNEKAITFWSNIAGKYHANWVTLRARKFWDGKFWDSMYFDILRDEYERAKA